MRRASEKVELTAACDVREDAVRQFAGEAGIDAVYTDATVMLKEADIDAVIICVSHDWHAPLAMAAAKAGKHVLLEKPMAVTLQQCRDIIAAAEKAGVTLMVAQQFRHVPSYIGARRLIQQGALGRIWGARADVWLPIVLSRSSGLPARFARLPEESRWLFDGRRSGGVSVIQNAIHFIDLFRYLIGDARRVFGRCWTDHPAFTNEAEDRAMITIEFQNGAIAHISNSWTTRTPWFFQFMVFGDEGSVYTPIPEPGSGIPAHGAPAVVSCPRYDLEGVEPGPQSCPFVPIEAPEGLFSEDPYANELVHFLECCQQGTEPVSSGRDNLETMKVIFGIYQSSRTGQMVNLSDL
jgi:predicted dehydrogenase